MCDWGNADYREGAHSVEAVPLGRGKGKYLPYLFLLNGKEYKFDTICKLIIINM